MTARTTRLPWSRPSRSLVLAMRRPLRSSARAAARITPSRWGQSQTPRRAVAFRLESVLLCNVFLFLKQQRSLPTASLWTRARLCKNHVVPDFPPLIAPSSFFSSSSSPPLSPSPATLPSAGATSRMTLTLTATPTSRRTPTRVSRATTAPGSGTRTSRTRTTTALAMRAIRKQACFAFFKRISPPHCLVLFLHIRVSLVCRLGAPTTRTRSLRRASAQVHAAGRLPRICPSFSPATRRASMSPSS